MDTFELIAFIKGKTVSGCGVEISMACSDGEFDVIRIHFTDGSVLTLEASQELRWGGEVAFISTNGEGP